MKFRSPWRKKNKPAEEEPEEEPPLSLNGKTHAAYHAYKKRHNPEWNEIDSPGVGHPHIPTSSPHGSPHGLRHLHTGSSPLRSGNRNGNDVGRDGTAETHDSDRDPNELHLDVFPKSLLSCAVADKQRGWVFPEQKLWVRNPSNTETMAFRVQALRHEDVFVKPNKGALRVGEMIELTFCPAPIANVAEDPATLDRDFLVPEPNALAIVAVVIPEEYLDVDMDDSTDDDSTLNSTLNARLDALFADDKKTTSTEISMPLDVSAARECARAVAALEHAAEAEAMGMVTPRKKKTSGTSVEGDLEAAESDVAALKSELDFALEETQRARREADAHAAAARSASEAAGAASERLERAEFAWHEERDAWQSDRNALTLERDAVRVEAETAANEKVTREMTKRKAVVDDVVAKLRSARDEAVANSEEAQSRVNSVTTTCDTLRQQLKESITRGNELETSVTYFTEKCEKLERELKNDRAMFSRKLQSSSAARDFAFNKAGLQMTIRALAGVFSQWRKLAVVASDAKRVEARKKLEDDLKAFEDERKSFKSKMSDELDKITKQRDDALATAKALAKRLDLVEQSRVEDLKEFSKKQQVEIENLRVHLERRDGLLESNGRQVLSDGSPGPSANNYSSPARRSSQYTNLEPEPLLLQMTRRVNVDVVVDVDENGAPTVLSETVKRVRLVPTPERDIHADDTSRPHPHRRTHHVSPTTLFAKASQAAAAVHGSARGDNNLYGAISQLPSAKKCFAHQRDGEARVFSAAEIDDKIQSDAVGESLRNAGRAARHMREPWNPPNESYMRTSREWE